jgi:3D (Asp-Asp-Asp) domain-containing protein
MFKKMVVAAVLLLIPMLGAGIRSASAQDSNTSKVAKAKAEADEARKTPEVEKTVNAYRLDFSVNEIEDGKKINTRQYSMNLNAEDGNEIKIGTRVPVEAKQGEFQYLDVGTNIWCRIGERANGLALSVRAEVSNFAMPDQQEHTAARPVLRQLEIHASTVAQLGKPIVIGSVDDPNSKRQFQLEVTVTKLK